MFQRIAFLAAACLTLAVPVALAQDVLDRTVGRDAYGRPLEFRAFTSHEVGAFAQAARAPIGFEALPAPANPAALPPIVLTGRTVREAVAAMTALDSRYRWREDAGVILFEPAVRAEGPPARQPPHAAWDPLDSSAPAVRLGLTTGHDAFAVVAALLGAPRSTAIGFSDTKPFMLDAPEGTVRELLNAIVRSHGHLVWMFEHARGRDAVFPYTLSFLTTAGGFGIGLSGDAPERLDLSRFLQPNPAPPAVLDTLVGTRRDGDPLVLTGLWMSAAGELSAATGVPFGMQAAPLRAPRVHPPEFTATGRTLGEVLAILAARDDGYEWRVVDGTIVIRPAIAWGDSQDPLFALVPDVDLRDATMTRALRAIVPALGGAAEYSAFPDTRTVSLTVTHGTALDLLTALMKAHGSLTWTLSDAEPAEIERTGLRHRLTLGTAGGLGVGVLVR